MPINDNGLNRVQTITSIIKSTAWIIAFFVALLFSFFNLKTGLSDLTKRVENNEKKLEDHVKKDDQRFARYVPGPELAIEFRSIKDTLGDIKSELNRCRNEDAEFKQQLFDLMLEIKKERD